jgi:hypothetical protein
MFLKLLGAFLSLSIGLTVLPCFSEGGEAARRKGFYQHQAEERQADLERESGLRDFLAEQAAWDEQRQKDRKADQKRKKAEAPGEDSPEYKANLKERMADYEEQEAQREKFVKQKKAEAAKDAQELAARDAWAMEEQGLTEKRPRFDVAKRALFGGGKSHASSASSGSRSSSVPSTTNYGGGGNPSYPEPQYNNEFDNYVPPPPFPDQGGPGAYFPPPTEGYVPPPPAYPMGGEDTGVFYPPPPPPPQGFDGGY